MFAAWVGFASWPLGQATGPLGVPILALARLEQDVFFAARGPQGNRIDPRIAIVGFDTNTELDLGQKWPPSRAVLAKAIENLTHDGARVIALDVLLEGHSDTVADKALDGALSRAGNVVLAARIERDPSPKVLRKTLIGPFHDEELRIDFESHAQIGLTDVPVDDDGIVRRFHPVFPMNGEVVPSFAVAVFLADKGVSPDVAKLTGQATTFGPGAIPLSGQSAIDPVDGQRIPSVDVNYPGGGASFPVVADLAAVAHGSFAPGTFMNKVVFVGVTGSQLIKELRDATVNSATAKAPELVGGAYRRDMPGLILQAHNYNAIVQRLWLSPVPGWVRGLVAAIVCWFAVGLAQRFYDWRGVASLLGLIAGALVMSFLLFALADIRLPLLPAATVSGVVALATGWLDRTRLRRRWAGYVSPSVMKVIFESDGGAVRLRCRASVLFADIRGFTSIAEHLDPEETLSLLNRHFSLLAPIVAEHGGTIDKYMGDGLLAVFGAPVPFEGCEAQAVAAAIAMLKAMAVGTRSGGEHELSIGIGIATGEVVAGEVGSNARHDFTVIGEVVNLASRLQGESNGGIVVDSQTAAAYSGEVSDLGPRAIRGLSEDVDCFAIVV